MKRRSLLALPGAVALAAVRPALAQAPRVARIGLLRNRPPATALLKEGSLAFSNALRARGWVEGSNLQVLTPYIEDRADRMPGLVAELLAAKVDVIVVLDDGVAADVRSITTTTPIVFMRGVVPVELGLVSSLARPGGNVTGVVTLAGDLAAKQIELARSIRPDLERLAVMWFPDARISALVLQQQQAAAAELGVELVLLPLVTIGSAEWDAALAAAARAKVQMFSPHLAPFVWQRLARPFADWAIEHRIVVFGPVEHGFVLSYAPEQAEVTSLAAGYVDRILRGARPADLPVERPRRFRLGINARTARAMRLTIPKDMLARADVVIE